MTGMSAPPDDLVSVYEAEKRTGIADSTIHAWLRLGRIAYYGRGGNGRRVTVLVSIAEVEDAASWRSRSMGGRPAAALLHVAPGRLPELCAKYGVPFRRFGPTLEVERAGVERLASELGCLRRDWWSFPKAARETGLPVWVFERWEEDRRIEVRREVRPGGGNVRLVRRAELEHLVADVLRRPDRCPGCNKPVAPGRTWHRECAGPVVSRAYWRDCDLETRNVRRNLAAELARAWWWDTPEGVQRRAEQSETGWPKPRSERVLLSCFLCGRDVPVKASVAASKKTGKRRTTCEVCHLPWISALFRARWAIKGANQNRLDVVAAQTSFEDALAIGKGLQDKLYENWPHKLGRRPPIAVDLAIEAMYAAGYTDVEILYLLEKARATDNTAVLGIQKGKKLNDRYITRRRQESGIVRRRTREERVSV